MGAALGSLRERVAGFMGNFPQNELPEGSLDDIDLEWGRFWKAPTDENVNDINGPVEVYEAVPYPSPQSASIEYECPQTEIAVKEDIPRSRQRFLNIVIWFPQLCTYLSSVHLSPAEVKILELALARLDKQPIVRVRPITSEPYQRIVVHAPPYRSVAFKVSKVKIVSLVPNWDYRTKKYTLRVFFSGPHDMVTKYMLHM